MHNEDYQTGCLQLSFRRIIFCCSLPFGLIMSVVIGQLEDRVTGTECKTVLIRRYLGVGNPREINAEDMKRAKKLREGITVLFRAE